MKIVKALAILLFFSVLLGSCFDPPEYPSVPEIEFQQHQFFKVATTKPGELPLDSLIIYLNFKDGDGDLGIDAGNPYYVRNQFYPILFFQENNGELGPLNVVNITTSSDTLTVLDITNPDRGKLIYPRTAYKSGYSDDLPLYNPNAERQCAYQTLNRDLVKGKNQGIFIEAEDLNAIDSHTKIIDTIDYQNKRYFRLYDSLYVAPNPNHYNIEVEYWIRDSKAKPEDEGFVKYDWFLETCQTMNGRFPVLSDKGNALEGTLRYAMKSTGFRLQRLNLKSIKLRIQIKDRALNKSNTIETPEFPLL